MILGKAKGQDEVKMLFLGDVTGRVGRNALKKHLFEIVGDVAPDVVIANGENAAGGVGLDDGSAEELYRSGINILTTGNHVWNRKDFYPYLDKHKDKIVRPLNYAEGAPGVGSCEYCLESGTKILVVNLIGRVFMPDLVDCPFASADSFFDSLQDAGAVVVVDFHAEATSEKAALGYALDGRAAAVLGTHTHVQTSDERVLPKGTAYISDVGMCGPYDSVIGMKSDLIVQRFRSGLPVRFDVAKGAAVVNGVVVRYSSVEKRALSIERIKRIYP